MSTRTIQGPVDYRADEGGAGDGALCVCDDQSRRVVPAVAPANDRHARLVQELQLGDEWPAEGDAGGQ